MSLPPSEIPSGAMRFNSDSQKLEYWDGSQWVQVHTFSPNLDGGARGVLMGGSTTPGPSDDIIDYINISSTGDAVTFGTLSVIASFNGEAVSDSTRGVLLGGRTNVPTPNTTTATMQYVTISSKGNSTNFGNLQNIRYGMAAFSNSTRGIACGGNDGTSSTSEIEYITIQSTGNSVDFSGASTTSSNYRTGFSSPTRGISAGGFQTSVNTIEFVTISTLGEAQDFGDLSIPLWRLGGCSNPIRGIIVAGESPSSDGLNIMEYITISTLGNSTNFGDVSQGGQHYNGTSSSTRGVFAGRQDDSPFANLNNIEYVNIMTEGNAVDFGDLSTPRQGVGACSNAHGGL